MKALEDLKDVLEEQIKKITKKNDITPAELDSVKKALEVMVMADHIKEEEEMRMQGEASQGMNSNHYPYYWKHPMYENAYDRGNSYDRNGRMSMDNMPISNDGGGIYMGSYDDRGRGTSYDGRRSYDMNGNSRDGRRGRDADNDGRYSEDYSERRGRDRMGRYTSRDEGRSRDTEKQMMVARLEDMLDDAKTERERKTIEKCLDKIDR